MDRPVLDEQSAGPQDRALGVVAADRGVREDQRVASGHRRRAGERERPRRKRLERGRQVERAEHDGARLTLTAVDEREAPV